MSCSRAAPEPEHALTPRDFAPVWRELQDGSLLLSWGGEDTSTTIVVTPQANGRWAGTATHRWYDGTSTVAPAELEPQ
jgi:hypothetical protein